MNREISNVFAGSSSVLNYNHSQIATEKAAIPSYEVRLAKTHELDEVFALRYDVFLAAYERDSKTMKDTDHYDEFADHLIVKADDRVVATYRVLPVDRILNAGLIPYSANEFDLGLLLETFDPRTAVELGRSCVHPAHRNGSIPRLLWSALASYMMKQGRSEAFGCVSVFNVRHAEAIALVDYFKALNVWSNSLACPALTPVLGEKSMLSQSEIKAIVPPLLRSYLTLGAKLHGGPSHDPVFHSHDFLIHFSTTTMTERCRRSLFS